MGGSGDPMDERFLNFIIPYLQNWGYLIVLVLAFLETSALLGLLVPGESVVVVAGLLAGAGHLHVLPVIAVASVGAIVGDTVGYFIGHHFGESFFRRYGRYFLFKPRYLDDARMFFAAHGGKTVFLGRFVGYLRAFAPVVAGMSRMPYGAFLVANVAGGIAWATTFTLIGYCVGNNWSVIEKYLGRAGIAAFAAGVAVLAVYLKWTRRHRERTGTQR